MQQQDALPPEEPRLTREDMEQISQEYRSLAKSQVWVRLVKFMQEQIDQRRDVNELSPADGMKGGDYGDKIWVIKY